MEWPPSSMHLARSPLPPPLSPQSGDQGHGGDQELPPPDVTTHPFNPGVKSPESQQTGTSSPSPEPKSCWMEKYNFVWNSCMNNSCMEVSNSSAAVRSYYSINSCHRADQLPKIKAS